MREFIKNNIELSIVVILFILMVVFGCIFLATQNNLKNNRIRLNTVAQPIDQMGKLSPDKSLTVFVRDYPQRPPLEYAFRGGSDNEIWIKNNNTGQEMLLVKSGDISEYPFANSYNFPFSGISNLSSPIFSLDGKKVYFMSNAWAVCTAIFSIDISTGKLNFISDGFPSEVVDSGEYKGNLMVCKHKYYGLPEGGSYDHFYIINEAGKEIKDLGNCD